MELSQPRSFGAEGRKPTHDFLSLYSSQAEQDPRPSPGGGYLKTHDFLQPLERAEKGSAKEETDSVEILNSIVEKPQLLPPAAADANSVEHILPGGIGTYSISHISYFNQRVPKSEGVAYTVAQGSSTDRNEDTSNCSSYTESGGFTLWEESALKKGKAGKENVQERASSLVKEPVVKMGQWTSERPSQPASSHHNSFSSLSTSQPLGQKSQSFMDMIKSVKESHEEEEDYEDEFIIKKEGSSLKGDLTIKTEGKNTDQKANTPRSKHSATEQRRRSKINDRFQMLRELIPHSDQKRDKASFLLEVIEYIHFLQEKVQKYEGSYQAWNHDPPKLLPSRNNHRPTENLVNHSRGFSDISGPPILFGAKVDENHTIIRNAQNPVKPDIGAEAAFRGMDPHSRSPNNAVNLPMSLQPNLYLPVRDSGAVAQVPLRPASDAEKSSQPPSHLCQNPVGTTDCSRSTDKAKEQEMTIKGGKISISSVYSQGLLNTLTEALQSSGVDLSQASISVQIELGKRPNGSLTGPSSIQKDTLYPTIERAMVRSRVSSCDEESSDRSQKRLKLSRS